MTAYSSRPTHLRALSWITALLLLVGLSACGGSDGEADPNTASDSSAANTDSAGQNGDLPDGFPDVPLPDHDEVRSGGQMSETSWRVMLAVDLDADGAALIADYADRLAGAGYEVKTSPPIVSASNDQWSIDVVMRPPTITFQVIERD